MEGARERERERERETERENGIERSWAGWLHWKKKKNFGDSFSIIVVLQQSLLGKRKLGRCRWSSCRHRWRRRRRRRWRQWRQRRCRRPLTPFFASRLTIFPFFQSLQRFLCEVLSHSLSLSLSLSLPRLRLVRFVLLVLDQLSKRPNRSGRKCG